MKDILLLGGFGFTGLHLINEIDSDTKVIVYSQHNKDPYEIIKDPSRIIFESGDITDSTRLDEVVQKYQPEIIVHMAALTGIKKCHDHPQKSFQVNVYGTYNAVTSAIKSKSRFILLSSREVYGDSSKTATSEDDPKIPNNVYGLTKLHAENIVLWANKRYGLDYTIVRPTNLYGPGGDKYGAQVLIKKIVNDEKIQILGGQQRMNFIFVEEVANAIKKIIVDGRSSMEAFNVGSHDDLTVNEFAYMVARIARKELVMEYLPMRETETLDFKVSIEKIKNILGWTPRMTIESGLAYTINWYQKQITKSNNKS